MRKPAVAGQFYPANKDDLMDQIRSMVGKTVEGELPKGVICPHAGYVYSGAVAGSVFASLTGAGSFIVLNPNHTGQGSRFSLSYEDWLTPLGVVKLDKNLADSILERTELVEKDADAHKFEHSAEVQLPFIQYVAPEASVVVISMGPGNMSELEDVASAISSVIADQDKRTVIVASSDMTHYEERLMAARKDRAALDRVLALDGPGLIRTVMEEGISMCGSGPVSVMIMAAKQLGAQSVELIEYTDSGQVTGDTDSVVGYAGVAVY